MKKTSLLAAVCLLLISCGTSTQKKDAIQKSETTANIPAKKSLWTNEQRENFINTNARYSVDTLILQQLITAYEFEKNDSVLQEYLKSFDYEKEKLSIAKKLTVNIDAIATETEKTVKLILGEPTKKETINPSGVGSCQKFTYLGGLVEVVYINSKADWITVNNTPSKAKIQDVSTYRSVQQFSDYTYVKVKTK